MYKIFTMILLLTACSPAMEKNDSHIFIRVNQLGFYPGEIKTAVILSDKNLTGKRFFLVDKIGNVQVFSDFIKKKLNKYADFNFVYEIDFSDFKDTGKFFIRIGNSVSPEFTITQTVYDSLPSKLLTFFKVQRCGYTDPLMHEVCHIADVTEVIDGGRKIKEKFDVTGGWHDAGDYTKFLNTTAFSTYMLLFAYDFAPDKFSFDENKNGVPDILEEAKIGLDWLLRANYRNEKFITQVQNEKDQSVGWRLPERDPLQFDRPGFVGVGKNLIGIYTAALALGARIWRETINFPDFADRLESTAKTFYDLFDKVPDIDTTGTGFYIDKHYEGKMALGSIEMYLLTKNGRYFDNALEFARKAGPEAWWGWGNVAAIADYRIAKIKPEFVEFIEKSLEQFAQHSNSQTFGECVDLYWGSNLNLLGAPLMNILYKDLTGEKRFDKISVYNRDFILGRNPWGISFIYDEGSNYTRHFHHQIAYFNKGKLPGGVTGGPVMKSVYGDVKIEYSGKDSLSRFQTEKCFYRDDKNDYICNEPTISTNATAIFVFGLQK